MATFKPGDRVRILPTPDCLPEFAGCEAVFGRYETHWLVAAFDCFVFVEGEQKWGPSSTLVPLTDPGCERFIASLEKLAREPGTIKDPAPEWDVA